MSTGTKWWKVRWRDDGCFGKRRSNHTDTATRALAKVPRDAATLANVTVTVRDTIAVYLNGEPADVESTPDAATTTKPILDAADGKPVTPGNVLGQVAVEFFGDFAKGAFSLVPAGEPCPAEPAGLRLRTEAGRALRSADDSRPRSQRPRHDTSNGHPRLLRQHGRQ